MYSAHGARLYFAEDAAWIVVAGSGYLSDAPQTFALALSVLSVLRPSAPQKEFLWRTLFVLPPYC